MRPRRHRSNQPFDSLRSLRAGDPADLEPFLDRRTPERIPLRDDQIEGAALVAAALICGAVWLVADIFRRRRRAPGGI